MAGQGSIDLYGDIRLPQLNTVKYVYERHD